MIGKIISHYKILEELGRGGMGVVYKAEDARLKRLVALKFLPPDLTRDEKAKERFMQEARAASSLDHNNICTIYEIDEIDDGGRMFIAMAYYEGETLKQKVTNGKLQVADAIDIAIQIAQGLEKAHGQGIIHRDIKPANIMITIQGEVKIVDFGLAKLAGQTKLSLSGALMGTVAYMSPEQAHGESVDHRTDIWALGVVLYEMLTGRLPFQSEYEQAVIYAILNKSPESIPDIVHGTPRQLDRIILKALEKNTADRFQDVREVQDGLEEFKKTLRAQSRRSKKMSNGVRDFLPLWLWSSLKRMLKKRKTLLAMSGFAVFLSALIFTIPFKFSDVALTERKISVAVMPFNNNTGDPALNWSSQGIADMFVTNLSRSRYIRLISLDRIRRVLSNMGEENIKEVDQDFSEEFARRMDAQFIIAGSIFKSDSKFRMIVQMYDMRSAGQMKAEQVEGEGRDSIMKSVDQLSNRIKVAIEIEAVGTSAMAEEIARVKTNSVEAYQFYLQGQNNKENMDYEKAILNFKKATQIDTAFAYAYDELAGVYNALGEISLAKETITKAIKFSDELTNEEQLRFLSNLARLTYDYNSSEEYLRKLAVLQPDNPEWRFRLGWHYSTHKRSYDRGILEYNRAIELDSDSQPQFYYYLGYAYLAYGLPEKAISAFKEYVALLPNEAISHDQLGKAYVLTGDYESAHKELLRALELNPDFASTLLNLGMYYVSTGKGRKALKYYKQYQKQTLGTKEEELGCFFLSRLYLKNSKLDEALIEIKKAVDLNPTRISSLWLLGLIQLQRGHRDSAQATCEKMENNLTARGSKNEMEFVHHLKGKIYQTAGQFDAAIEQFQQAIILGNPDQAYFRNHLAEAYFLKGDFDQAIRAYNRVFEINPNDVYGNYGLGQAYEKKSKTTEAIQAYERCLEIWNNADSDMLLVQNVKRKLAKLKHSAKI